MEPQTLQQIINSLEADTRGEQAYFGIFTTDEETIDGNIRANPRGLKLFAAEILKAADAMESNPFEPVQLGLHGSWVSGNVYLDEVHTNAAGAGDPAHTTATGSKAGCYVFIAVLIALAAVFITGLVTVVQWAMQWIF